jgi:hypothetical protein
MGKHSNLFHPSVLNLTNKDSVLNTDNIQKAMEERVFV